MDCIMKTEKHKFQFLSYLRLIIMYVLTLLSEFELFLLVLTFPNFQDAIYDLKNDCQDAVLFLFFLDSVQGVKSKPDWFLQSSNENVRQRVDLIWSRVTLTWLSLSDYSNLTFFLWRAAGKFFSMRSSDLCKTQTGIHYECQEWKCVGWKRRFMKKNLFLS